MHERIQSKGDIFDDASDRESFISNVRQQLQGPFLSHQTGVKLHGYLVHRFWNLVIKEIVLEPFNIESNEIGSIFMNEVS